jgi:hypothetical protein
VTPLGAPLPFKLTLGAAVWMAFLVYIFMCGAAARSRGQTGDVGRHERETVAPTV